MESKDIVPEGSCAFYIDRKRRFCRFRPSTGQKYCAEHAGLLGIELEKKRIPCPLDPKHTCYESKLAKHLKKCRNKPGILPAYHCAGINSGSKDDGDTTASKISFSEIPLSQLQKLVDRINQLYDRYIKDVDRDILTHPCLNEELGNETYGIQAIRHRKQQASLIGHLEKMGLLHEGLCYVELGAGKGGLSHWIQKALHDVENISFVLVDRGHVRYKFDNLHKWEENEPKFERLRIDIENLNLAGVESISRGDKPLVAVGKHLCGCATDLALRCLMNGLNSDFSTTELEPPLKRAKEDVEQQTGVKFGGLTVALCCHHRCTWRSYVGKKFFSECGLMPDDFQIICKLSGWATDNWKGWKSVSKMQEDLRNSLSSPMKHSSNVTNESTSNSIASLDSANQISDRRHSAEQTNLSIGSAKQISASEITYSSHSPEQTNYISYSRSYNSEELTDLNINNSVQTLHELETKNQTDARSGPSEDISNTENDEHQKAVSWKRSDLKLSDEERELIGWKCKRLIDFGRVCYLKDSGLHSDLKIYIDHKLTPENVAIFALPNK